MNEVEELKGANMYIDLLPNKKVHWEQSSNEGTERYRCAIKMFSYANSLKELNILIKCFALFKR